jgi:hypothetical protein
MAVSTSSQILPPPVGEHLQADLGISRKVLNASPANGAWSWQLTHRGPTGG